MCLQNATVSVEVVSVTSSHMPVHFLSATDLICCVCMLKSAGQGKETEVERILK